MRRTKIVATLGPASDSAATIGHLIAAGADVFRLNASYGTHDEHLSRIRTVREQAGAAGKHTAILLDLQGPKIRLGHFQGGTADLRTGSRFSITAEPVTGTAEIASTTYPMLAADVKPGERVLLADGAVELRVLRAQHPVVEFEVVSGGTVSDRRGINLPDSRVSAPSLTEKDLLDLAMAVQGGVDLIALSFVRSPENVRDLRTALEARGAAIPVVSKIEKPEALAHLDEIIAASDGVMVARGDLGVEMALEKVPMAQKRIIEESRRTGAFVITATQMLESMIENPVPTRAEVSDVANAIFDGSDALMLSAETARGKYPVEAVRRMAMIAAEADTRGFDWPAGDALRGHAGIIAKAACQAARSAGVRAIVVFTVSGSTARLVARERPSVPIYAFTPGAEVARRLMPIFGVRPVLAPGVASTDQMIELMERTIVERGWMKPGDSVVFVAGQPPGVAGNTNLIKLHSL